MFNLFALLLALAPASAPEAPPAPIVYAVEVYDGNRLVRGEDVSAAVGQAVEFALPPQTDTDVGLVGHVWPVREDDGAVHTRVWVDADWVDLDDPNGVKTVVVSGDLAWHTPTPGVLAAQRGDYRVLVIQKTP